MSKVKQKIVIVMDKSGSMANSREDVIGGFNTYIGDLKEDESISADFTLIMFDDNIHTLHSSTKLQDVGDLCKKTYNPNGSTALNDAIMEGIKVVEDDLAKIEDEIKPQVFFVVFTDGEENCSKKFSLSQVNDKKKEKESEGWAFIFMGADIDAWASGSAYQMSAGNTMSLNKSSIAASTKYLRNRTSKAAKLYDSSLIGAIGPQAYAQSMSNIMAIDEDDLLNDAEAVSLRTTIDSQVQTNPKDNQLNPPVNFNNFPVIDPTKTNMKSPFYGVYDKVKEKWYGVSENDDDTLCDTQ